MLWFGVEGVRYVSIVQGMLASRRNAKMNSQTLSREVVLDLSDTQLGEEQPIEFYWPRLKPGEYCPSESALVKQELLAT